MTHQALYLAAVCAKYYSIERTSAGYLILSDVTPKNRFIYHFCIIIKAILLAFIFLSTRLDSADLIG